MRGAWEIEASIFHTAFLFPPLRRRERSRLEPRWQGMAKPGCACYAYKKAERRMEGTREERQGRGGRDRGWTLFVE